MSCHRFYSGEWHPFPAPIPSPQDSKANSDLDEEAVHWRSTIPVWAPYRPGRYWFAGWDLARRLLLTGLLTLIPMGRDGGRKYQRVAAAFALAGLTLAVGEAARPYRDPWISWIYRAVSHTTRD